MSIYAFVVLVKNSDKLGILLYVRQSLDKIKVIFINND